jgi:hypothetical protein
MNRSLATVVIVMLLPAISGCGIGGGDEGAKLADELKSPLSHAYGPIDSINCERNDHVKVLGGKAAYDCRVRLTNRRVQSLCAGFAKGVPLFDHTTCDESNFPRG